MDDLFDDCFQLPDGFDASPLTVFSPDYNSLVYFHDQFEYCVNTQLLIELEPWSFHCWTFL